MGVKATNSIPQSTESILFGRLRLLRYRLGNNDVTRRAHVRVVCDLLIRWWWVIYNRGTHWRLVLWGIRRCWEFAILWGQLRVLSQLRWKVDLLDIVGWEKSLFAIMSTGPPVWIRLRYNYENVSSTER